MVLVRWDPWSDFMSAQREMQDVVRRFFGDWTPPASSGDQSAPAFAPAVDVFTRDGNLVVRAELPGIDPDNDVDISLEQGVLSIRGERRREETANGDTWFRAERHHGTFERRIAVPSEVKAEDITASYTDGILEVVVPQVSAEPATKKIPVQVGGHRAAITAEGRKEEPPQGSA